MLRNKYNVYGEDIKIPSHLHFGKALLEKMLEFKDIFALTNADTNERITYGELAQNTMDIALSLTRMGVRKGEVVSICSEKRFEVMSTMLGVLCAGATFSPTDITYGTGSTSTPSSEDSTTKGDVLLTFRATDHQAHRQSFDSVGCVEHYIIYQKVTEDRLTETTSPPETFSENKDAKTHETLPYTKQTSLPESKSETKDSETPETSYTKQTTSHPNTWSETDSKTPQTWTFKDFLTESANEDFEPVPVEGYDRALILFSSGTTGLPKGVPHTHIGLLINSLSISMESYKGEGILTTREWYYTYGLLHSLACLGRGASLVYSLRNTHADCLAAIQNYKIKHLQLTPVLVSELIKSPILDDFDLSSVEAIISSSTTIMAEQVDAVKRRLPNLKNVYQIYGTSEAGGVCTELWGTRGPRGGSVGTPSHGFILKVVDLKSRQPVGVGVRGEICMKSPSLTPGYLGVSNRDYMDEEGFYKTGDVGYYDEDNYFYIVNRVKELIKYNDISIAPSELESILLQHPAVRDAGVVGAPSQEVGEAPTAFVVLQPGGCVGGSELRDYLEDRITYRMRLAGGVRFVEELPRGAGGKLDRNELKNMLRLELDQH